MISDLQQSISTLKEKPEYQPLVEQFGSEIHDIFESLLTTALTDNPGQQIDGAAVLATLMRCFKEVSRKPQPMTTTVPVIPGLPSERYGRNNNS